MWEIPGQERAADVLRRSGQRGEVGHAWAFLGPPGVGQEQAARSLTAALVCPIGAEGVACGACETCERCSRGAHPAYLAFSPAGANHRVVDVRERWLPTASRSAGEGGWKVLRVIDADRMNDAAANAFLKGLEEPPPRTVWLLDVADPDDLPDTILSRCRSVRFAALGASTLDVHARRLGIEDADERALAVRACLGSPARLEALSAPGALQDLRAHRGIPRGLAQRGFALVAAKRIEEEVERRVATLEAEAKAEKAHLATDYADAVPRAVLREMEDALTRRKRETRTAAVQAALDDVASWYRDLLLLHSGAEVGQLVHGDDADALRDAARELDPARIIEAIDRVLDTRAALERNVGARLALEALFMDLTALGMRR